MSTSNKIAILSLIVGIIGVIVAILVAFIPSDKSVSQITHGNNSPSVINNDGNVTIK